MLRYGIPGQLELKLVWRTTARTPLLTATGVLSLAIGITLAATAYGIVAGLIHGRLDVPEGDRIVQLRDVDLEHGWDIPLDFARYQERRSAVTTLAPLAAYATAQTLVGLPGTSGRVVSVATFSQNGFDALRVRPQTGRLFTASDPAADAVTAVALGATLARDVFGSPQAAIGRALLVDNQLRTVVAVLPNGFRFPHVSDAWIPATGPGLAGVQFTAFGRLAPSATIESAEAEYAIIGQREREAARSQGPQLGFRVRPFATIAPSNSAVTVGLWLAVASLVVLLLVSAANVANLLLARTAARGFEFAVRAALGASRMRLVAQIGIEALAMSVLGAVLGVAGAAWALNWFQSAVKDLPYWVNLSLRWDIVAFVVATAALATTLVALVPARQLSTAPLAQAIRDEASGFRFGRFSSVLIAVEFAIATALLGAVGSAGRGLASFGFGETGIPAEHVLIAQLYFGQPAALTAPNAPTDAAVRRAIASAFHAEAERDARRLVERLAATTGVAAVTRGSHFPGNEMSERTVEIEGDPALHRTRGVQTGSGYFEVLGTSVLFGRDFNESEGAGSGAVAIVNARFAERYGLGSAIGRRIRYVDAREQQEPVRGPWLEIVGVVPDLALNPGNAIAGDGVYTPLEPTNVVRLAVRTAGSPLPMQAVLHEEALKLAMRPSVQWSKSLSAQMGEPVALFRSLGIGLVVLGAIALLLSGASIYALLSLRVTRQRREIAVRLALGAPRSAVVRTVLGSTLRHVTVGSIAGLALALLVSRSIAQIPYEIGISDGGSFAATALILAVIGAAACAIPLRRALRLRPMALLRES
jgi:predicted permease